MMQVSQRGLELIVQWEGFRPTAYLCQAGVPTIGFGHTKTVTKADVARHKTITKAQALDLLREDAADAVRAVNAVKVGQDKKLTQCQFDALVSLVYNCGPGPLVKGGVGSALRQGKLDLVPSQIMKYNKARNPKTKVLEVSRGLVRRRNSECAMWRAVDPKAAFPKAPVPESMPKPPVESDEDDTTGLDIEATPSKPLAESGTVKGAVIAAIGGVSVATQTAQPIIEQVQQARTTWDAVSELGTSALVIGLVIMAVGIGYVVYRRYRDRHFL